MFSDLELETIEAIIDQFAEQWVETRVDQILVDQILTKIDKQLNG